MDYKYKPDDYETKLIVLYSLNNLKRSPSYQTLSRVVTKAADISYFEIQIYIDELKEVKSVTESVIDGETVYSITSAGEEMCEYFSVRIPASVREKIENEAREINGDKSYRNKIYADYIPINEKEFKVKCGILEDNLSLLDFEMYAGSRERAKEICLYFKHNTKKFYQQILSIIDENLKK